MKQDFSVEIKNFINFSLEKLIVDPYLFGDEIIKSAFEETVFDFCYHFPKISQKEVRNSIFRNSAGLPVFLYRLVKKMDKQGYNDDLKYQIHFLMKVLCGCEIYWTTEIGKGFNINHGVGTVIGSRCKIGEGFRIYQGCTVGHKGIKDKEEGPKIGKNVTLFANSQILGKITVGNNVTIGANSLVIHDVESGQFVAGNPAKQIIIN